MSTQTQSATGSVSSPPPFVGQNIEEEIRLLKEIEELNSHLDNNMKVDKIIKNFSVPNILVAQPTQTIFKSSTETKSIHTQDAVNLL